MPFDMDDGFAQKPFCENWWSQAGSNRRPPHCERGALPAELWPLKDAQRQRCRWAALQCGRHLRLGVRGVKKRKIARKCAIHRFCLFPKAAAATCSAEPVGQGFAGMIELLSFISLLLQIYVYILIASAVLSWLIAFNVVNTRSPVVHTIA